MRLDGRALPKGNPRVAMARGLALVPEDRRKQGLVLDESVTRNITLAIRSSSRRPGCSGARAENARRTMWASRLEVKTAALDAETGTLSGGNQQKVVLGKWLATEPKVLIVDEPTRGIDVGTKAEVHRLLSELAQQGIAILMISSELPGGARHGRPRARHARGPPDRRVPPRGSDARGRHVRGDHGQRRRTVTATVAPPSADRVTPRHRPRVSRRARPAS